MLIGQPVGQESLTVLEPDRRPHGTAPAIGLQHPILIPVLTCKPPSLPQANPSTLNLTHQPESRAAEERIADLEASNRAHQAEKADMQCPTKTPLANAQATSKTQLTQPTQPKPNHNLGSTGSLARQASSPALSARTADRHDSKSESAPSVCKTNPLGQLSRQICNKKLATDATSPMKSGMQCRLL